MSLAAKHSSKTSSTGLDLNGLGDLASMLGKPVQKAGRPMDIPLDKIKLRPQVRTAENPGLTPESIAEIGASIAEHGVKTPISVCDDPDNPGEYFVNHGERRYRGSLWAKKDTIPAFIDNDHDEDDQIIENIQRENLTPREIADYMGRKLSQGTTQAEIAKTLGKTRGYVSQYVGMLHLPDPIAQAVTDGRVNDVTVANELARAYREDPQAVDAVLQQGSLAANQGLEGEGEVASLAAKQTISRGAAKAVRDKIALANKAKKKPKNANEKTADYKRVERAMADHLGTAVILAPGKKDTAQLIIKVHSWEHFDGLLDRMGMGKLLSQSDEV
ncbi:ParB/RepB/Spo0J family partition protein [Bordetella sp. FB-8]|uniref:ParB/RepB/Spo0J family partition protein n=1 Tax=Bordetella sp. FB-8 TaxID=1159870 RepID=UPI00037DF9A2|nr:ParB/RepB/Spo0J family partition protein [Bordetella sp. FB-8]